MVEGDPGSDWLWCIDPLDGTTNFAHGYPSFATSIGALNHWIRASMVAFAILHSTHQGGSLTVRIWTRWRFSGDQ